MSWFPIELLYATKDERMKYFDSKRVAHPFLKESIAKVIDAVNGAGGESLVFVYGPSGVGKSTLVSKVEQLLREQSVNQMIENRGMIPIAKIEAIPPERGNFEWKGYYRDVLTALQEPLIDFKINYSTVNSNNNIPGVEFKPWSNKVDLRRALMNALHFRSTIAVIVDEAQHLTKVTSGRKLQDQLDIIKSLANTTGTIHILVGTYELLPFLTLSGQLSRRTVNVHFPRYNIDKRSDVEAFVSVLQYFQNHLPVEKTPDLVSDWQYFYTKTIGCIGTLKKWLRWVLHSAVEAEAKTITLKDCDKYALSNGQCHQMLLDILEGERRIAVSEKYDVNLQLDPVNFNHSLNDGRNLKENIRTKSRSSVGKRNPVRDPVGGYKNAK